MARYVSSVNWHRRHERIWEAVSHLVDISKAGIRVITRVGLAFVPLFRCFIVTVGYVARVEQELTGLASWLLGSIAIACEKWAKEPIRYRTPQQRMPSMPDDLYRDGGSTNAHYIPRSGSSTPTLSRPTGLDEDNLQASSRPTKTIALPASASLPPQHSPTVPLTNSPPQQVYPPSPPTIFIATSPYTVPASPPQASPAAPSSPPTVVPPRSNMCPFRLPHESSPNQSPKLTPRVKPRGQQTRFAYTTTWS